MRKLTDITDSEINSLKNALGYWNRGKGVLTREEFIEVFFLCKYPIAFDLATKAYKWFVKNDFEV